ncbi:MAG: glycosyltransferase family 2 protein [Clostridiales bacterium]|nr:glycosyltransferase family 2 protein [Clostridiales bacterium]
MESNSITTPVHIEVSVIVPVFNGEKYLRQCLDSICCQTLQAIEIICVDDGSTDSSFEILQGYKERDNRIQLYRQENKFAGAARNLGKSHATGEYLVFWDCDDFFERNALEELYTRAVFCEADICVCGANKYLEEENKLDPGVRSYLNTGRIPDTDTFNRDTNEKYILNFTTAAPWNKMFRREFIENCGLDFQEIRNGNDIYFVVNALCRAKRISVVEQALVTYRTSQKSNLTATSSLAPLDPLEAWISTAESLEKDGILPERSFANRSLGNVIHLLRNITEYGTFIETVKALKTDYLKRLHITETCCGGFYYPSWHQEIVAHLYQDTPEQFLMYFSHMNYLQLSLKSAEKSLAIQKLKGKKEQVEQQKERIHKLKIRLERKNKALVRQKEISAEYRKKIDTIETSVSFRIGRVITWLPRMIRKYLFGH